MDKQGKYESKVQKIGLSCDAFCTGCLVMCLLFFVPYVANSGGVTVMWFVPIACLVPFALMPLIYLVIHKFDTLLFGRYHFVMPVAAFLAAPFFVMAWSARGVGASQSCLVFFGMLVFAVSAMVYRYCAFSVRSRLTGTNIVDKAPYYELISAAGCVAAVVTFAGFMYYDKQTAYVNTSYVMAAVFALIAIAQYLLTFYGIPRLGGRRALSVKSAFGSFYSDLDKKLYFSILFFEAAFASVAVLFVYFGFALGVSRDGIISIAAVLIVSYGVSAGICSRYIVRRSIYLSLVSFLGVTVSSVIVIILAAINAKGNGALIGIIISAIIAGSGGAISMRQSKLRFLTVKPRITSGAVYILSELTMFAAAAIALFVASGVVTLFDSVDSAAAFILGFAVAVVLGIAAFALSTKKRAARPAALPVTVDVEADGEAEEKSN